MRARRRTAAAAGVVAVLAIATVFAAGRQERPAGQGFTFKTGVELVNVTVTVTDASGRFVSGLHQNDFAVFEDGREQAVSQFDAERVPVSLGIALDTSGSMAGAKIAAARAALHRFLFDLLGPQDEMFLYQFNSQPTLVHDWTSDRQALNRGLESIRPFGGTALYDTVAEAVPMAQSGTRRKKALLVLSDGNDTSSRTDLGSLEQLIRRTEVLVYAIGIDVAGEDGGAPVASRPTSHPVPSPFPGKQPPPAARPPRISSPRTARGGSSDRVNAEALRELTLDSGGRTEIISSDRDLDPATAGIADELSRQYFLGYASSLPKDGQWHTIEVRVRRPNVTVRARRGFIAN